MSGSRTTKEYTTDGGVVYNVITDESNAEGTTNEGQILSLAPTSNAPRPPAGFRRRYVNAYLQGNDVIKRRFYIGNRLAVTPLTLAGATINAVVTPNANDDNPATSIWVVTSYRGEATPVSPNIVGQQDTGLIDGDLVG